MPAISALVRLGELPDAGFPVVTASTAVVECWMRMTSEGDAVIVTRAAVWLDDEL